MPLFHPEVLSSGARDAEIPTDPIVVLKLVESIREGESVYIGPHLMNAREIDELVDRLISEAEAFRRLAKHELDVAQSRARKP